MTGRNLPGAWRPPPRLFLLLAIPFALAALFHLAAVASPGLAPDDSPWRHALFVVINLGCAVGFVRRPRWLLPIFAVLVGQQLWSHGADIARVWSSEGRVDLRSLGVLLFLPIVFALLVLDWRATRPQRAAPSLKSDR